MRSFEWIDATSVEQAATLLAETTERKPILAKAGGIDLLDLMKEGILAPARLVNLKTIAGLDRVRFDSREGLDLGAMVTLTRVDADQEIRSRYVALADAAGTPLHRRSATLPPSAATSSSGPAAGTSAMITSITSAAMR